MYKLMVTFEPMKVAPLAGRFNYRINLGNVATENEEGGAKGVKDVSKRDFWHLGGDLLKSNCPQLVGEEKKV